MYLKRFVQPVRCEGPLGRVTDHQATCTYDRDLGGPLRHQCQVVQHRHYRDTQAANAFQQFQRRAWVEVVGWLVKQQYSRLLRQRPREMCTLTLAARKAAQRAFREALQGTTIQCLRDPLRKLRLGELVAMRQATQAYIVGHAQAAVGVIVLPQRGDHARAFRSGYVGAVHIAPADTARNRFEGSRQQAQQRGLASAVWPHDRQVVSGRQLQAARPDQRLAVRSRVRRAVQADRKRPG